MTRTTKEKISIRDDYKKGGLAKEILKGLAIGGLIVASLALPNLPQVFSLLGIKSAKDRYRIKRAMQTLQKQKLIEIYEKEGKEIIKITEGGKKRVLIYKFDDIKIIRPKKWDNLWRVISFDIPEKHRKERKALSNKLNDMEIYPLQKSVFICPFPCKDEIDFVSEILNIRKYIHLFIAKNIDPQDETILKNHYNL
jgi:DNA-binding transcriptional regulator PaaX